MWVRFAIDWYRTSCRARMYAYQYVRGSLPDEQEGEFCLTFLMTKPPML